MIELRPMRAHEFSECIDLFIRTCTADHMRTDGATEAQALAHVRESLGKLLPQGAATPEHYFYTVHCLERDARVGTVWVGVLAGKTAKARMAHVFDIHIDEPFRRMGYAKQAFRAIEPIVRELGLNEIGLHVFGFNDHAYALYRQLGYRPTHISMAKSLDAGE
ncbi:MAG: GNAT family N-acetyltransferase [Pararobbsia sp.]